MNNLKKISVTHLYTYLVILPALISLGTFPAKAQATPDANSTVSTTKVSKPGYESLYVVINAQTDKGMLESIENKLKNWGVQFKAKDVRFSNGLLTGLTVETVIPGVDNSNHSIGNGKDPLGEPLIFYHESAAVAGLSSGVPEELSAKGKLVVIDNLKGVLIMHNGGNMELSGTFHTKW